MLSVDAVGGTSSIWLWLMLSSVRPVRDSMQGGHSLRSLWSTCRLASFWHLLSCLGSSSRQFLDSLRSTRFNSTPIIIGSLPSLFSEQSSAVSLTHLSTPWSISTILFCLRLSATMLWYSGCSSHRPPISRGRVLRSKSSSSIAPVFSARLRWRRKRSCFLCVRTMVGGDTRVNCTFIRSSTMLGIWPRSVGRRTMGFSMRDSTRIAVRSS
mmetsp:Transcript_20194/g.48772  ORF Transcript_20194/g.48772 Transcript_20194/m.48772 type:complete len:211 (-) Transcript_20194:1101-1733(-)